MNNEVMEKLNEIIRQNLFEVTSMVAGSIEQELDVARECIKVEHSNEIHKVFVKFTDTEELSISISISEVS